MCDDNVYVSFMKHSISLHIRDREIKRAGEREREIERERERERWERK